MALTIHHLHMSQSERITFLCEELSLPYDLKLYARAPTHLAPPEYKALHPQGTSPVIQHGAVTLAESGACVEYIAQTLGGGALFAKPSDPDYADFQYWWHWSNGTFQPAVSMIMACRVGGFADDHWFAQMVGRGLERSLGELDARLAENEWLAGGRFTAADVMLMFSLTTMRYWTPYGLGGYGHVLAYVRRVSAREGYRRAMARCEPEMELALGAEAPKPVMG